MTPLYHGEAFLDVGMRRLKKLGGAEDLVNTLTELV